MDFYLRNELTKDQNSNRVLSDISSKHMSFRPLSTERANDSKQVQSDSQKSSLHDKVAQEITSMRERLSMSQQSTYEN